MRTLHHKPCTLLVIPGPNTLTHKSSAQPQILNTRPLVIHPGSFTLSTKPQCTTLSPMQIRQQVSQISNLEPANVKVYSEYTVMLRTLHPMYLFLLAVSPREPQRLDLAFNIPVTIHGVNCSLMCPYVSQRTPARRMKRKEQVLISRSPTKLSLNDEP